MYIKAKELAQRLGVTIRTIYSLANTGQLPAGVKFGKSRRWDWEQVKEFINKKSEVEK